MKPRETSIPEQFRLFTARHKAYRHSFPGESLLNCNHLRSLISLMMERLQTGHAAAAASLFSKHYGRALCGGLYALSMHGRGYDLSLPNVEVCLGDGLEIAVILRDGRERTVEPEQKQEILRRLFADNLRPLFDRLSRDYAVHSTVLWENFAVYVHHFYPLMMRQTDSELQRMELQADYDFITQQAPPELFGVPTGNPLDIPGRWIEHPHDPSASVRMRRTCCFKHLCGNGNHCISCPCLTEQERNEKLKSYGK